MCVTGFALKNRRKFNLYSSCAIDVEMYEFVDVPFSIRVGVVSVTMRWRSVRVLQSRRQ